MKNARPILFLILLFFLVVGTVLYLQGQEPSQILNLLPSQQTQIQLHDQIQTHAAQSIPVSESSLVTKQIEKTVTEIAPSLKMLRADVAKNPHVPARSYILFASILGKKMDAAENNTEKSEALFNELATCTDNLELPENVRALCLSNAYRMNLKNKDFQDQYNGLRSRTDAKIVHLAE